MKKPIAAPRLFALTRETGDNIVGYGMVLPDGSAHSVSWSGRGTSWWSADSAEKIAECSDTELSWIGDEP